MEFSIRASFAYNGTIVTENYGNMISKESPRRYNDKKGGEYDPADNEKA